MNLRTTLILFALLGGAVAVFLVLVFMDTPTPSESKEREKWVLPSLNDAAKRVESSEITRMVIERRNGPRLEFVRRDNGEWRMVAPREARTDTVAANRLVEQLVRAQRIKEAKPESSDLHALGLDNPAVTVTLHRKDQSYTVKIAQDDPKLSVLYATSSDVDSGKTPLALGRSTIEKVFAPVEEFRAKELLPTPFRDATAVRLTGANRKPLEIEKVEGNSWRFKEPNVGEADNGSVDEFVRKLPTIRVEKNEDFIQDDNPDLAKYGLAKPLVEVTLTEKSRDAQKATSETLLIGTNVLERDAALAIGLLGPMNSVDALSALAGYRVRPCFAKLAGEKHVVRLNPDHLKIFDFKVDDWRNKSLLPRSVRQKVDTADALSLAAKGETLRLRRANLKLSGSTTPAPAKWTLYADQHAKAATHLKVVEDLISALTEISLKDGKSFLDSNEKQAAWFAGETVDLGLDKPQAELSLWVEGIKRDKDGKPEHTDEPRLKDDIKEKPSIKLSFGKKDDKRDVVYVKRELNGDPSTAVILAVPDPYHSGLGEPPQFGAPPPPRQTIRITALVTGGYYAFRDHTLPSFNADDATTLNYTRGGETLVFQKEEKKRDDKPPEIEWILKEPVSGKGRSFVDFYLDMLSRLSTDHLITDKATEQELKDFGLAEKPLLKTTVAVKEKEKTTEYVYTIGKATDPKGPTPDRFYARVEKKPAEGSVPESNQFIFLLPKNVMQFLDTELRDTTVFQLQDPKTLKPETVTFTWKTEKDKKIETTRLELEYKAEKEGAEKTWMVKSLTVDGKDAKANLPKLDVVKIEQLLGTAASPRPGPKLNPLAAERFYMHLLKGKADAKLRLDAESKDNPPALVIEIGYDNKTSRTLTLGGKFEPKDEEYPGLRQKAHFFAASSSLPNAVFLLNEADFKDLVAGWSFFKPADKPTSES